MAKGDRKAAQNAIDYGATQSQQQWNNMFSRLDPTRGFMYNTYNQVVPQQLADYRSIMNNYRNFMNPGAASSTADRGGAVPPSSTGANVDQWLTGDPMRDPVRRQAFDYITKAGGTPTGRGSGPTDLEYYVDQMLKEPGYGDWAGRVQRGISGTQPGQRSSTGDPFYDAITNALGGYGQFAETGGFSPEDIQNIRARSVAPIRGVYSQAQANLDRQRRLAGSAGAPNYAAAQAKLARDEAYGLGDVTTNAEAAIAQMLQQGRLAGLGGLGQVGMGARGQNLSALSGMSSLYSASPGQAQVFGNQLLNAQNQDLEMQQLQQRINEVRAGQQMQAAQIPGNFRQAMGNIGNILGLLGQVSGGIGGIPWGTIGRRLGIGGGTSGTYYGGGVPTAGDFGTPEWYNY